MYQMQTTLPIGSVVGERYAIEAMLGKGGSSAVYLVQDLRVQHNLFALKELIHPDQYERRQLAREAELLKHTDHPSLPRVYRFFEDAAQDRAYLLMDYIEGSNLDQMRRQRTEQRFSLRETLALIRPIVEALTYLHAQQPPIIHRDIKPANIIAPASGGPTVLVDFGIAKEFSQEATTSAIRHATPGYGAPEHYSSGTDTRTDIYGLGATVYTFLTGVVPIDAFTRLTHYLSKKSDPLPSARQLVPALPEHVSTALERAMTLESAGRFASVEDFWLALQPDALPEILSPAIAPSSKVKDVSALGASRIDRTTPPVPARRRRRVRLAALLLIIFLALGVGFASALLTLPGLHPQQTHLPIATPGKNRSQATATTTLRPTSTPTPQPTPTSAPQPTPTSAPQPTPTPPPPTPAPPLLPALASTYTGTIHNSLANIDSSMSLNGTAQQQQNIQGNFSVNSPLSGSGPFSGAVASNDTIRFTVHSPDVGAPLFFSGTIQKDGSMSGSYCSLDSTGHCNPSAGGYGNWAVRPGS